MWLTSVSTPLLSCNRGLLGEGNHVSSSLDSSSSLTFELEFELNFELSFELFLVIKGSFR